MDTLKEIVLVLLQVVITSCVPVLMKYGVDALLALKNRAKQESDNEHIDNIIERVGKLIIDVVTETTQTYVDNMKQNGQFTVEAQKEAFHRSYSRIVQLLNDEYKGVIVDVFGNLQNYLTTQIESAVAAGKKV